MNFLSPAVRAIVAVVGLAAALPVSAQYPGQVAKTGKGTPELRSIGVLEWTGELGKPKASRLVPVAVLDGGELQDGSLYMARPEPMALAGEVEYELLQEGKPLGLFDIKNAGQEQGSWVGYGAWKPMPAPKKAPSMSELAKTTIDDEDNDHPVLHRKKHADNAPSASGGSGSGGGAGSSEPAGASDPDRPTLHKKSPDDASAGDPPPAADPDRPTVKKGKRKQPEDIGHAEALPDVTDPDRPTLKRGKSTAESLNVLPSLMGMPKDMQQIVAVSDSRTRPEHPWSFSWANADDEEKMKSSLEDIAREALGLSTPAPHAPPAPKRTSARKSLEPAPPPPPPAPLAGEQFRVFELAYGSGATMVLSAHTDGAFAQQKFITLVAQPDLYGNVLVLLKNVTDGSHLDDKPRMRLVDAVDAMADNRGELLFELRGNTQRQFALYRVLRGQAEKLFTGGGGEYGIESRN